jgi:Holliday junction resolvase RusA-like endonuclease
MSDPKPAYPGRAVTFTVPGVAAPAGSKRGFVNRRSGRVIITDDSKRSKPWQARVADAAIDLELAELLAGPLMLRLTFHLPRPAGHFGTGRNAGTVRPSAPEYPTVKPDVTKLVRAVEDALTGLIWRDDAQVVDQQASKLYGAPARCEIHVHEIR